MAWLSEQYAYFDASKYEDKGTWAKGVLSFTEKQKDGSKLYSRFYCIFSGEAYEDVSKDPNIKSIKITSAKISNPPYTNASGEKVYPKNPTIRVMKVGEIEYDATADSPF